MKEIKCDVKPDFALILGSGLSDACPEMENIKEISYKEVGLPESIVKGHKDSFIFGDYKGIKILKLGRFHYYESGDLNKVSLPFEILAKLGVKKVILATATGGISDKVKFGELLLIKDHINLAPNPLIGRKDQYFLDMSSPYNEEYRNIVKNIVKEQKLNIEEGIHLQVTGPSYETKAEVGMFKQLGIDTVSMSTAQDVILCRFFGMEVLAFALICDKAGEKVSHEEVCECSRTASDKLKKIISKFIEIESKNKV